MKPNEHEVRIDVPRNLPPPEGVNFFNLTVSGPEVEMLVGYLDLRKLLPPQGSTRAPTRIEAEISHRYLMSFRGLLLLKSQIADLEQQLVKQGIDLTALAGQR